jgi:stage II sporulation protein D
MDKRIVRTAVLAISIAAGAVGGAPESTRAQSGADTVRVGMARQGSGYDVVAVDLETYVARVLGGEAAPNTAVGAIDALAIAVRTYALFNIGRHASEGFDVCDQVHCQVVRTANPDTERAAQATAGKVLLRDGAPARIFYSASCGGQTEIPSAVWPGEEDPPYMPSRRDDACRGEPVWQSELTEDELQRALEAAGFRGRLRNMSIASYGVSGRVATLRLDGMTPGQISLQDLRMAVSRAMGPRRVMSGAFELRRNGGVYQLNGRGYGHGVGMCVFGAMRLAEAGEDAAAILARYYPGLTIGTVRGRTSNVSVTLPAADSSEQSAVSAIAAKARTELAQALGVAAAPAVALRVHASPSLYEAATSRPWFTSGALVNGEIHVLPLAALRARGTLERTVRHEIVHLLVDDELRNRPLWVREGLAIYFAELGATDAQTRPAERRRPCPTDAELLRPTSAGAHAEAAARARACVARQLQTGRTWREIR